MKATDLVKSLSLSSITSEDFKVVTLYKGQSPDVFLVDNIGDGEVVNAEPFSLKPPTIVESQNYSAVYNNIPLVHPMASPCLNLIVLMSLPITVLFHFISLINYEYSKSKSSCQEY